MHGGKTCLKPRYSPAHDAVRVGNLIGVSLMMPLAQCMGNKDIFYNIGNMILLPRAEAALMTEYE